VHHPVDLGSGHQRGLLGTAVWKHQPGLLSLSMAGQRQAHGQCAANRPDFAAERQLAGKFVTRELAGVNLTAGGQNSECDRQIEAAGILGQVGRCQVDGDSFVAGKFQSAVLDRGSDAFSRFLDLGLGQANQREAGQAVGQMHFDANRVCLQS